MFYRGILPWTAEKNPKVVEGQKETLFSEARKSFDVEVVEVYPVNCLATDVFGRLPSCFLKIAKMIDEISAFETPNYDYIHDLTTSSAIDTKYH